MDPQSPVFFETSGLMNLARRTGRSYLISYVLHRGNSGPSCYCSVGFQRVAAVPDAQLETAIESMEVPSNTKLNHLEGFTSAFGGTLDNYSTR